MKAPLNSRYAHSEGLTDICLYAGGDGDPGKLVTCGSEGDVRVWTGPEEQDPAVFSASDTCFAVAVHGDTVYVGVENNFVESYALPGGKCLGVIARFTAAVNHLDVSNSGKIVVAGSGDMTFQIISLNGGKEASTPPVKVEGHSAPVLSVLIDPLEEFVVSSSCDGSVCVWTVRGKQMKNWDRVFPSSNDIMISSTLCRPSWHPSGKILAVPKLNEIHLYNRSSWDQLKTLKNQISSKALSVTKFSRCGKFLAAGSTDGSVLIWEVDSNKLVYENVDTKDHITGLTFSKSGKDVYAVDMKGRMIFIKDFGSSHQTQELDFDDELEGDSEKEVVQGVVATDDPFDDDMDDLMMDDNDDPDPDGNEISISKIKAMTGFIASEKEDVYVGVDKAKEMAGIKPTSKRIDDDDDNVSVSSFGSGDGKESAAYSRSKDTRPIIMPFTEPQPPFQPSSSPEHIQHRFMAWNSVGIVSNYTMEDDDMDAIDVEFHDVSFHNAIHLRNQFDYTIAALGKDAVAFGSRRQKGVNSKLMVLHFSSWDNNKEWSVDFPAGEDVIGLTVGAGWLAAATDVNRIRLFTLGGVQKNVIEIGGQIVSIAGHEDLLFITFHSGIGLHGNQSISVLLLKVKKGTGFLPLISNEPLPLSPKAQLTWVGFSDEGTPAFSDSREYLKVLNGRLWSPFMDMKEHLAGEQDHFWVTGVSICSQHVRAIKCKGVRYPAALPRPTIMLLDAKIPLCEMETEKSQLEDSFLRSLMLSSLTKKMDKKGFDVEEYKDKAERTIKENLMKLFAMCCKGDRDYRASEYVSLMPSTHAIQLAVKYASKLRKMALTDRLTAIGRSKMDEEEEGVEDDDDDFENMRVGNVIYSSVYTSLGSGANGNDNYTASASGYSGSQDMFGPSGLSTSKNAAELIILEENPLLSKQKAEIRSILSPALYKNPFKKGSDSKLELKPSENSKSDDDGKGLALIDAWKKPTDKPSVEFNPKHPKNKQTKEKKGPADAKAKKGIEKTEKGPKGKKLSTLFQIKPKTTVLTEPEPSSPASVEMSSEDSNSVDASRSSVFEDRVSTSTTDDDVESSTVPGPQQTKKTGFSMWFEENKDNLESQNPDCSLSELTKIGTQAFNDLPTDVKQVYLYTVTKNTTKAEKKRKRSEDEDSEVSEAEKKTRISSKLAAFVRNDD